MVFYRKYRPQTIEELDSKDVRDKLYAVLSAKDIAHAFLFTGPKGLGKTSTARIVAKVVNCEHRNVILSPSTSLKAKDLKNKRDSSSVSRRTQNDNQSSIEPCNKCYQCISITNGTNLDILEIDGASNRGIDEIRDLREKVRLSAARAAKKVYIIDEVHMLTTEAFNALLKTLEEPPPHVIFILCTTEPHKLPPTIVSRCFHIAFKKAGVEELVRSFKRIAKKENLDIDDEALNLVASLSDGSFRDGTKILEEIALESKGAKITKEIIEKKYQIRHLADQISQMLEVLSEKNTRGGLQLISKLTEQGVNMKYFIEQLINVLHGFLLHKVGVKTSEEFSKVVFDFSITQIKDLVELLAKAYADLKYAVLPQLPLEMVIVEWGEMQGNERGEHSEFDESSDASAPAVANGDLGVRSPSATLMKTSSHRNAPPAGTINNFWQELINKVKIHNHSIAAVLRGCGLKEYNGKNLVIETKYKFHKDKLEEKKAIVLLEKACEEITGGKINVAILLKGGES